MRKLNWWRQGTPRRDSSSVGLGRILCDGDVSASLRGRCHAGERAWLSSRCKRSVGGVGRSNVSKSREQDEMTGT